MHVTSVVHVHSVLSDTLHTHNREDHSASYMYAALDVFQEEI